MLREKQPILLYFKGSKVRKDFSKGDPVQQGRKQKKKEKEKKKREKEREGKKKRKKKVARPIRDLNP